MPMPKADAIRAAAIEQIAATLRGEPMTE